MWRALGLGAALLLALVLWNGRLASRAGEARMESSRVADFFPLEVLDSRRVSGVSVTGARGRHLYARLEGGWRCLTAHGAPADESAVAELVNRLTSADGVVHSREPERARLYGMNPEQMVTVGLHGGGMLKQEDLDLIWSADVGLSMPGTGGCYARAAETDEVWAIDQDLRELAAPPGLGSLPPLLEKSVTTSSWVRAAGDLTNILVEHSDAFRESFDLVRRDVERTEEEAELGMPPWDWILTRGTKSDLCEPLRIWSYLRFFAFVPYRGILDPAELTGEGARSPRARLRLSGTSGKPLELTVYSRHRAGGYPVHNSLTGTVYLISQEIFDLLLPEPDQVIRLQGGQNPWEPWLLRDAPGSAGMPR